MPPPGTGPCSSAASRRHSGSRCCRPSTGIRSGPRRRSAGLPISFHVGSGSIADLFDDPAGIGVQARTFRVSLALLHGELQVHRRPDLRRHLPPLPRSEVRLGGERRRLDPVHPRGVRLAVAQRRRQPRAPRVRAGAERVFPAADLRLLLVRRGGRAAPRWSCIRDNMLFETDFPHPTCACRRGRKARPCTRATTPSARCRRYRRRRCGR